VISEKQLNDLGFSPRESHVYLALLELGPSVTTRVARKAKINRTTCYDILESLIQKKLVSQVGEAKIQKFVAESPDKIVSFIKKEIEQKNEKLNHALHLLPELLSIYNTKQKPKIKFYSGVDEIKEAFEDTLNATGEILAYAVGSDMFNVISPSYFEDYSKKKVSKNIHVRVIAPNDEVSKEIVKNDVLALRTSILVPKEDFYFSIETNIYNNKVLTISWKEKFAVVIESREIAESQRKIFELAWRGAQKEVL